MKDTQKQHGQADLDVATEEQIADSAPHEAHNLKISQQDT